MGTALRPCWRNCAVKADDEILAIDQTEDQLPSIDPGVRRVRQLITGLEICHHKAERWIDNIILAIGAGDTSKGLGTSADSEPHVSEVRWEEICTLLSCWCDGRDSGDQLTANLGERTPLKIWQVQRVVDKIRSLIRQPQSEYTWLMLDVGDYDFRYRESCPDQFQDQSEYWRQTARTRIHDTIDGVDSKLSLALAIDMLWPCHRRFETNLQIVLDAIGGRLDPAVPFAACGRNIGMLENQDHFIQVSDGLRSYCENRQVPADLQTKLGDRTPVRHWLAASLDKTIRLQVDPPPEMRRLSAMDGPDWIRESQNLDG